MDNTYEIWREANRRATEQIGGPAAVAKLLGYQDRRNVSPWTSGTRQFPAEHCATLERAASSVTRQQLRPDDWKTIWPELAKPRKPAAMTPKPSKSHQKAKA